MKQSEELGRDQDDVGVLGSIFGVLEEGNGGPAHWKRNLMIRVYPYLLLAIDFIVIVFIFSVLTALRYDEPLITTVSRRVLLAIVFPSILASYLAGSYRYSNDKSKYRYLSEYVISACGAIVVTFGFVYSVVAYGVSLNSSRMTVLGTLCLFPIASISYRFFLARIQQRFEQGNAICIIGAGTRALDVYQRLKAIHCKQHFIVLSDDVEQVGKPLDFEDNGAPIVRGLEELDLNSSMGGRYVESYVVAMHVDELPPDVSHRLVVALFHRNRIYSYENFLEERLRIVPPSQLSASWPLQEGFRLTRSVSYDRFKRLSDIAASILGIVIASPILIGIAIAVKLTSKGPVIFKQSRTGQHEKPFMIYKFRSMTVGSEKGSKYTTANDVRFTPIGKFIRKIRVDELPQLWNVLKGDLSLIGPRAEWVDLVKRYETCFPYYHFRHAVKPGITGWAQVNYSYGQNDQDTLEKLNYDLYYVRRYSLTLDVGIVIKTIYMVMFGRGQ